MCDKHKLAVDEYSLRHMDVKTEFALTLTVEESGINECCLVKKDRHSGTQHSQLSPTNGLPVLNPSGSAGSHPSHSGRHFRAAGG